MKIATLDHDTLVANDVIIGLRAELATARAAFDQIASADAAAATLRAAELEATVGRLSARVEELEIERERSLVRQREEIDALKASPTWRAGELILGPVKRLTRRGR